MKKILLFLAAILFFTTGIYAQAARYRSEQKEQERSIKAAYRHHKVTEREYIKLMDEQDAIKYAIDKYDAEGVWTAHQREVVVGKLERASNRLRKYKTNWER